MICGRGTNNSYLWNSDNKGTDSYFTLSLKAVNTSIFIKPVRKFLSAIHLFNTFTCDITIHNTMYIVKYEIVSIISIILQVIINLGGKLFHCVQNKILHTVFDYIK